jgi:hypothetical protein
MRKMPRRYAAPAGVSEKVVSSALANKYGDATDPESQLKSIPAIDVQKALQQLEQLNSNLNAKFQHILYKLNVPHCDIGVSFSQFPYMLEYVSRLSTTSLVGMPAF